MQIYKLEYIKIKNICLLKDFVKRMKKRASWWEKVFAVHIFNKTCTPNT